MIGVKGRASLGIALGLVVVLTIFGSGGGSSSPAANQVLKPPYHGSVSAFNQVCNRPGGSPGCHLGTSTHLGCVNASAARAAFFNLRTGHGGFHYSATSTACSAYSAGNTSFGRYSEASGGFDAQLNLSYHGGRPTVYANFTYSATAALTFLWGTCRPVVGSSTSSCSQRVNVDRVVAQAWVRDTTGNVSYTGNNSWLVLVGQDQVSNMTTCTSTSGCSSSVTVIGNSSRASSSGAVSWRIPLLLGMVKGHVYQLDFEMTGLASTYCQVHDARLAGFSGSAGFDFAPTGYGFLLPSIVET